MTETPESPKFELVSRREYARRKGFVPSVVIDLAAAGRISLWTPCPRCRTVVNVRLEVCGCGAAIAGAVDERKAQIVPAFADAELAAAQHPAYDAVREAWAERRDARTPGQHRANKAEALESSDESPPNTFRQIREERELIKLRNEQLEYLKRAGELCEVSAVRQAAARCGRETRDALLAIPDRLAPVLAAESDSAKIHALMREELERVLTSIADGTSALERDEPR